MEQAIEAYLGTAADEKLRYLKRFRGKQIWILQKIKAFRFAVREATNFHRKKFSKKLDKIKIYVLHLIQII
ncbi:MAG: hypothetical protein FWG65_02030 [Turicibacter sp.]|nr:hypothetical protein [Turicibacter sp.]